MNRPYKLTGIVTHGYGRGSKIGYPTANLANYETILPAHGVYATFIRHSGKIYKAVTNIGRNPTFDNENTTVESFLLDADVNLYGENIDIFFIQKLRGEIKFPSPETLVRQIAMDIEEAKKILVDFHGSPEA